MKIATIIKAFVAVFMTLSVFNIGLSFSVSTTLLQDDLEARRRVFIASSTEIQQASDYLTGMARFYVATGNTRFYERYWMEVNETRRRDVAVERLERHGVLPHELAVAQQAFELSGALELVEQQAFELMKAGDRQQAVELIFGQMYIESKEAIDNTIAQFTEMIDRRIDSEIEHRRTQASVFALLVVISSIVLSVSGLTGIIAIFRKTSRVERLSLLCADISSGNLNVAIDDTLITKDEVGVLAGSFNTMMVSLREHIEILLTLNTESERISTELDIATQIQAGMLPNVFPAFPNRAEFDIYASMEPAKEVGGDFYDFFLVDERTLAVVIADVSGKGVPAALFMVIAKTLLKSNAHYEKSPQEVFEAVNNLLCENNEAGMFVTVFMGYLDIPTGKFTFVNAGHNPPFVRKNGRFEPITAKPNFVLAMMDDTPYKQHELFLQPGDELFLYTDGIVEATNNELELFGTHRLLDVLNGNAGLPLKHLTKTVKTAIDTFEQGAEQADDITMLALRYKGNERMNELFIEAKIENIDTVLDFVFEQLGESEPKTQSQIGVVVDEIFANISNYAYKPEVGGVTIRVSVGDDISIEFEDGGVAYNPTQTAAPNTAAPAEERQIGGLGIHIVKNIMDTVEYRRENNKNLLAIKKSLP